MKKLIGTINKRGGRETALPNGDTPEASIGRGVRLFCESGGPNNSGEEVLHLPVIVEAAESSPTAAREGANAIRKFLSKDNAQRAYVQYNAIMLMRILADNPGKTFTRNLDGKFVIVVKELLREGRDMSVQQILRETMDTFEIQKADDENLSPLREMWKKEKEKQFRRGPGAPPIPRALSAPTPIYAPVQQNYFARTHRPRGLPNPQELAQRIEEAKTSAKLLLQVVQSTPPHEILANDLIKEFADRTQSASRSIQSYIHSDNPAPDDDTLLTLIETNDQLTQAMSRHQRAVLQARKALGNATPSASPPVLPPPGPPPRKAVPSEPQPSSSGYHEADSTQVPNLYAPQEPKNYGAPSPPRLAQTNPYFPGYRATASFPQAQNLSPNNTITHGVPAPEEPASPVEARQPVQYRF